MKVWWLSDQHRLRAEKTAIAELESSSGWLNNVEWSFDDSLRLRVVFDICLVHQKFQLKMTYHQTYPSSPPSVAPIENIRVSGHQYGEGGDLCLEIRPDNWSPDDYTGADMIQSAYNLFAEEAPDDDGTVTAAPSEHNVPSAIEMRGKIDRLYLSVATQQVLVSAAPDRAKVKLGLNYFLSGKIFHSVTFIHGIEKDNFSWSPTDVPEALADEVRLHDGVLIRAQQQGIALNQISNEDSLAATFGSDMIPSSGDYYYLVVNADGEVVLFCKHYGRFFRCTTVMQPQQTERRSGSELNQLSDKRVGIVGLGSLGSKIAVSLTRAGVGNFVLVDSDILHTGNLERHDADWRDIGLHKADITARRLRFLSPRVNCDVRRTLIGVQVSSNEAGNIDTALGKCDLVIDATAEVEVFNHLARIVTLTSSTLIWGAVFAGGVGSEIGRSRPKKDPSPFHIRNAIGQVFDNEDESAPLAASRQNYDGSNDDSILIATDAEVSATAALMTNLSLDALIKREPSRYNAHAYLIGHAQEWIFEGPFHVQPIISGAPLRTDESQPEEEFLEMDFINSLIRKKSREIKNSS